MRSKSGIYACIPARLDSRRLPEKHLRDIDGRPLLWYLVERLEAVPAIEAVVITTTDRTVDDALEEWANDHGIAVFRGSHQDVLGRFLSAAKAFAADMVVRANGDSPLIAPEVTIAGIDALLADDVEFTTGKQEYTDLPIGIGPEVIRSTTLERLTQSTSDPFHQEHVTTYVFEHSDEFSWRPIPIKPEWKAPDVSVTVDTPADLEYLRHVVDKLPDSEPDRWTVKEIISACREISENGVDH